MEKSEEGSSVWTIGKDLSTALVACRQFGQLGFSKPAIERALSRIAWASQASDWAEGACRCLQFLDPALFCLRLTLCLQMLQEHTWWWHDVAPPRFRKHGRTRCRTWSLSGGLLLLGPAVRRMQTLRRRRSPSLQLHPIASFRIPATPRRPQVPKQSPSPTLSRKCRPSQAG